MPEQKVPILIPGVYLPVWLTILLVTILSYLYYANYIYMGVACLWGLILYKNHSLLRLPLICYRTVERMVPECVRTLSCYVLYIFNSRADFL